MRIRPPKDKINGTTGIQVIARAAAVLRELAANPQGLTLGELAGQLGLARSTVQRIVDSLENENFVIAASSSRGVRLGPALLSLAQHTRFEITEIAKKTLHNISDESRETVALSLLSDRKLVFVDQVGGSYDLRVESPVGNSLPLHTTAPGKAILAAMSPARLERVLRRMDLTANTPNSITEWEDLEKELARVRQEQVAFDLEETSLGISALAVALKLPNGEYAAISIPSPTQRFTLEQQKFFKEILLRHATSLQSRLRDTHA